MQRRQFLSATAAMGAFGALSAPRLGLGALAAFVSNYHSLGVASYTSIRGRTVSVGVMGMVFVLDSRQDL